MMVKNIHRDPLPDRLVGTEVEIQFIWGEVATGRVEWIESASQGLKPQKYALITPWGGISFYKTHVRKINGLEIR